MQSPISSHVCLQIAGQHGVLVTKFLGTSVAYS